MQQFTLTCTYGGQTKEIYQGDAYACQAQRTRLKDLPQYKGCILQVRRKGAIKYRKVIDRQKNKVG